MHESNDCQVSVLLLHGITYAHFKLILCKSSPSRSIDSCQILVLSFVEMSEIVIASRKILQFLSFLGLFLRSVGIILLSASGTFTLNDVVEVPSSPASGVRCSPLWLMIILKTSTNLSFILAVILKKGVPSTTYSWYCSRFLWRKNQTVVLSRLCFRMTLRLEI